MSESTLFFAGEYTKTCQGVHCPLRDSTPPLVGKYTTRPWIVFLSFAGVLVEERVSLPCILVREYTTSLLLLPRVEKPVFCWAVHYFLGLTGGVFCWPGFLRSPRGKARGKGSLLVTELLSGWDAAYLQWRLRTPWCPLNSSFPLSHSLQRAPGTCRPSQGRAQKTRSGGIEHLRNLGLPIFLVRTRRADITWIFWLLFFFWCRARRALLLLLLLFFDVVLRGRLVSRLAGCP